MYVDTQIFEESPYGYGCGHFSGADEETDDDCVTDLLKGFAKNSTQSALIIWVLF